MSDQLDFFPLEKEETQEEKPTSCRYHRYANELDFVEHTQKNGKVVLRCKFCLRYIEQRKEIKRKQWEHEKENVTDYYVRRLFVMGRGSKLPMNEYPDELVQVKKAIIQIKREEAKQEERKGQIIRTCETHGDLTLEECIKAGTHHSGNPRYKCKACQKEQHARHYEKNKEKISQKTAEWRINNMEKRREYNRKYRSKDYKNYERLIEMERIRNRSHHLNSSENLKDRYVKGLLKRRGKFVDKDLTPEIIDLKRSLLLLKRGIKERNKK